MKLRTDNLLISLPFLGFILFLISLPFSVIAASVLFLLTFLLSLLAVFFVFCNSEKETPWH